MFSRRKLKSGEIPEELLKSSVKTENFTLRYQRIT